MIDTPIHPTAREFEEIKRQIKTAHGLSQGGVSVLRNTSKQKRSLRFSVPSLKASHKTKVIITGIPRSGTGFVKELLSSYPNSFTKGEVFSPEKSNTIDDYPKLAHQLADKRSVDLFALKFLLFQSPQYHQDIQQLAESGWRIIVTRRGNSSEQTLSHYLATVKNRFHSVNLPSLTRDETICVDGVLIKQLHDLFKRANDQLQHDTNAWGKDVLSLSFEHDIRPVSPAVARTAKFLGIPAESLKAVEEKTFTDNWSLIKNIDETRKALEL